MEVQCRKFRFLHRRVALALLPFLLPAAVAATAEPRIQARVAAPSAGMVSDDLIVYTADACEFGADRTGAKDSTEALVIRDVPPGSSTVRSRPCLLRR